MNRPAQPTQNVSGRTAILVIAVFGLLFGYVGYMYLQDPSDTGDGPQVSPPTRSYTPEERAAAQDVMSNARKLCGIRDDAGNLVVECRSNIPTEQRLDFAVAIADADAVLSGRARNIYYYLPGGSGIMFAQADPLHGVRLKQ